MGEHGIEHTCFVCIPYACVHVLLSHQTSHKVKGQIIMDFKMGTAEHQTLQGPHTGAAGPACCVLYLQGSVAYKAHILFAAFSLCCLGWPGTVARRGRKCGQPIQPHFSLLPLPNDQTELSSFPQLALLSAVIVSSTPGVLQVVVPGPAAWPSPEVIREMQIPRLLFQVLQHPLASL